MLVMCGKAFSMSVNVDVLMPLCTPCTCSLLELAGKKQRIEETIVQEHAKEDKMLHDDWKVRDNLGATGTASFDDCILNAKTPCLANSSVESLS